MENIFTAAHLAQRQSLPLSAKVRLSEMRIHDWYGKHEGQVYVSFSGGKDSTVLLHMVRSLYPHVPAVFVDTGLEFPEIVEFVKRQENVTIIRPKKPFSQVIKEYGYPVVSKQVAYYLDQIRNCKGEVTVRARMTGIKKDGTFSQKMKLPNKYHYLIDSPFKISAKCCDILKKEPLNRYARESGRKSFTAMMAEESSLRRKLWLKSGCNVYQGAFIASHPMMVWLEKDVWEYSACNGVRFSEIYYARGDIPAEKRTGCIFCMFGMERDKTRFARLQNSHPALFNYCMNKLGISNVLRYMEENK